MPAIYDEAHTYERAHVHGRLGRLVRVPRLTFDHARLRLRASIARVGVCRAEAKLRNRGLPLPYRCPLPYPLTLPSKPRKGGAHEEKILWPAKLG